LGLALAGKGRSGPRLTTGLNGCIEKGAEGEIKAGAGPGERNGPTHQNRGQTDPNREQSTHRRRRKREATGNWEAKITTTPKKIF
jgi:hypothetical protein